VPPSAPPRLHGAAPVRHVGVLVTAPLDAAELRLLPRTTHDRLVVAEAAARAQRALPQLHHAATRRELVFGAVPEGTLRTTVARAAPAEVSAGYACEPPTLLVGQLGEIGTRLTVSTRSTTEIAGSLLHRMLLLPVAQCAAREPEPCCSATRR
jgi:hypothetical protein